MPVTHSPGNPFAFTPVKPRGNTLYNRDSASSPSLSLHGDTSKIASKYSLEEFHKLQYQFTDHKETAAQEKIILTSRVEDLERRLLDEGRKMEKTESDKRFLFDLQAKQTVEISDLKASAQKVKAQLDAKLKDLSQENAKLLEKQISTEEGHRTDSQALMREISTLESNLANQRRAMETLKSDLTIKNDMLQSKTSRISDLEREIADKASDLLQGDAEDLTFVTKELASALSSVTSLEIANAAQLARIHVIQEKNAALTIAVEDKKSLEQKISLMDDMRQSLAKAEIRLFELEQEKLTWDESLLDADKDNSKHQPQTRLEIERLESQARQLEEQMNDCNVKISTLRNDLRLRTNELEGAQAQLSNERRMRMRLDRGKTLANKEISFLRGQLASYDIEEELESPLYDAVKAKRITELESLVDTYRQELAQMADVSSSEEKVLIGMKRDRETESDFNEIERGEYLRKIRSLSSELEIIKREDELLKKELTAVRSVYQATLDYPSSTTKESNQAKNSVTHRILQYKDNPTTVFQTIRTQTLKDLKTENEALLAQLSSAPGVVTVPIQSLRNAITESQTHEATIRQKDKMMQRLKEVFSAKSSEFREAVYSLLGYKLDFLPNGRVRLTSMYADQMDNTSFIFDGEAGTMQLSNGSGGASNSNGGSGGGGSSLTSQPVGDRDENGRGGGGGGATGVEEGVGKTTDGDGEKRRQVSGEIENLISFWSGERHSIPGMLSALTLELLEKEGSRIDTGQGGGR